jgi:rod shape determining protein RodA
MIIAIERRLVRNLDLIFLGLSLALFLIGIINLYSAAGASGVWKDQLLWFGIGIIAMVGMIAIDYDRFQGLAIPFYILCVGLLVLVLFIGPEIHHSRSWLVFGRFRVQPSELAKLSVVLMLARIFMKREKAGAIGVREIIYPLVVILIPAGLTALEPDMGTTLIFLIFGGSLLLFMGVRWKLLVILALLAILSAPVGWRYVLKPHQKNRILIFMYPSKDPLGAGYNLQQSKTAIGSGGILGKGWKKGSQNRLRFLPEQHTDFAFSVLAEEWGFLLGVVPALLLYLFLFVRGITIASEAKDRFGMMLALGVMMVVFSHFIVNLLMISGWFPVIGVPLPFFSYGGSHLVVLFMMLGLILNVGMRRYVF